VFGGPLRCGDHSDDYGREQVWLHANTNIAIRSFNRLGLRLKRDSPESFVITLVLPDSGAQAAGLMVGDRVLVVNGKPSSSLASSDLTVLMSGPIGSDIDLLVMSKTSHEAQSRQLRLKELVP